MYLLLFTCVMSFYFLFLIALPGFQNLSSLPGIRPAPSAVKAQSPNHWDCQGILFSVFCYVGLQVLWL